MSDNRKLSQLQEKWVARRTGGTVNAGSGSGWKRRHDVRSHGREGYLWELKMTGAKQITLKADDLESVRKIALSEGRIPIMGIQLAGRSYVIIEMDDFMEMAEYDGSELEAQYPRTNGTP